MSFSQVKYDKKPCTSIGTSRITRSEVEGTFPIVADGPTPKRSDSICRTKSG
jgi:hypothetical protein